MLGWATNVAATNVAHLRAALTANSVLRGNLRGDLRGDLPGDLRGDLRGDFCCDIRQHQLINFYTTLFYA